MIEARAMGGGAKSRGWNQIKADVLGLRYERLEGYDFAIRGCGIITAFGLGIYGDLDTAVKNMKKEKIEGNYIPNMRNKQRYSEYFDIYRSIFSRPLQDTLQRMTNMGN